MDGSNWINNTNWLSGDPCEDLWFGITCDSFQEVVNDIELGSNNLSGVLLDSFSSFEYLQFLYVFHCDDLSVY